jgi:oligoendopeptidase F
MQDPDANIRHKALENSNRALRDHASTLATALNAIAGTRITLQRSRGPTVHQEAIWAESMAEDTLEVMLEAVRRRRHLTQRYLKVKAAYLGKSSIHFADIGAPISLGEAKTFSWQAAQDMVLRAFESYHPELASFAQDMFRNHYIEAEPRRGKRAGAYCTSSKLTKTSRIFMTYGGALGDVITLAHELGHAYHNFVMADMRGWACRYPASLAETASILCESLVGDSILADDTITDDIRLQILSKRLHSASIYMLNIPMRYEFERTFYEQRVHGALSARALSQLMDETQLQVYGDVLDPAGTDPLFWASKLHFFLTGISFYNFPYTFGYLFSSGVLAQARRVGPDVFQPKLRALLRQTANGTVEDVAQEALGVDLAQPDFWLSAMDTVASDLIAFEAIINRSETSA